MKPKHSSRPGAGILVGTPMPPGLMILAGLALFAAGCATSSKIPVASTIERMGVVFQINDNQPFTGVTEAFYLSGRLKTSVQYRDGLKDGQQVEWREDGTKKETLTWSNGVRDGPQEHWYGNGRKLFEGRMQQAKWVGECRGWYPDGSPAFKINFLDGQGRGRSVEIKWNKDNLIRAFPDVKIDGEWLEWHPSGRITRQEKYQDGKLIEKLR